MARVERPLARVILLKGFFGLTGSSFTVWGHGHGFFGRMERGTRVELVSLAWKAKAQPLDQPRLFSFYSIERSGTAGVLDNSEAVSIA